MEHFVDILELYVSLILLVESNFMNNLFTTKSKLFRYALTVVQVTPVTFISVALNDLIKTY